MTQDSRTAVTYRYERWRAVTAGILETAATTFLLLVAVRGFDGGPFSKALIASGGSLGLILSPWVVAVVEERKWPVARAASFLGILGAASFLLMALVPVLSVFVFGSMLALTSASAVLPLVTQMYQENYPTAERGRLFSRTMIIRIATAALFSEFGGRVLSGHIHYYRWLLVIFAGASFAGAGCLARCPSRPLAASGGTHPFRSLRHVGADRVFRQTIIAWMFIGFAMLMMSPMRVEYLANPKYGVTIRGEHLTAGMVALFTGVLPNIARLLLNPLWGWLFDRMNFFVLRIALNAGFAAGILSFFTTGSIAGLVIGAILFGVANAGADLAWSLWVTKFAPPDRVADYMAVHTFFTGLRGFAAPVVAFYALSGTKPAQLGWISVLLIGIGSLFLAAEIKRGSGSAVPGEV